MHESIATALYRGEMRQFEPLFQAARARYDAQPAKYGRTSWLKDNLAFLQANPSVTFLSRVSEGAKKHTRVALFGLTHPRLIAEIGKRPTWAGIVVTLTAKNCETSGNWLPIKVAAHAVTRLMQRANTPSVAVALRGLSPAFHYPLFFEGPPPATAVLLPAAGGAVVAKADEDEPDTWVVVTYIDEAKLRPEQRAEVAERTQLFRDVRDQLLREEKWEELFPTGGGAPARR